MPTFVKIIAALCFTFCLTKQSIGIPQAIYGFSFGESAEMPIAPNLFGDLSCILPPRECGPSWVKRVYAKYTAKTARLCSLEFYSSSLSNNYEATVQQIKDEIQAALSASLMPKGKSSYAIHTAGIDGCFVELHTHESARQIIVKIVPNKWNHMRMEEAKGTSRRRNPNGPDVFSNKLQTSGKNFVGALDDFNVSFREDISKDEKFSLKWWTFLSPRMTNDCDRIKVANAIRAELFAKFGIILNEHYRCSGYFEESPLKNGARIFLSISGLDGIHDSIDPNVYGRISFIVNIQQSRKD